MMEKFKFIFKDFKKANKYSKIYDKYAQNPFLNPEIKSKTYVWVEDFKGSKD